MIVVGGMGKQPARRWARPGFLRLFGDGRVHAPELQCDPDIARQRWSAELYGGAGASKRLAHCELHEKSLAVPQNSLLYSHNCSLWSQSSLAGRLYVLTHALQHIYAVILIQPLLQ